MADAVLARSSRCRRSRSGVVGGSGHAVSSRAAAAAAPVPRNRGGETSSTVAPSIGRPLAWSAVAPGSRSSTRSPTCSGSEWSRLSLARSPPSIRTRATARAAPMCSVSRDGSRTVPGGCRCAAGGGVSRTSITLVTAHRLASMRAMPRRSSRVLTPRRFSATRAGPLTSAAGEPSDCTPLIRSVRMEGVSASSSPACTVPACKVPVTTVPLPLMANTRSSHSRTPLRGSGWGRRATSLPSAATSSGRPWPVTALTVTASIPPGFAGVSGARRASEPSGGPAPRPRLVSAILSLACRSAGAGSARSARVTTRIP